MSGFVDKAKGRMKEAVGGATDDDDLKREGKADNTVGKVKDNVDDAADAVRDKFDKK